MSALTLKGPEAQTTTRNRGWRVTFAALGVNLALGILYTWSVIAGGIPIEWGWTQADKSLPYAVACLVFSIVMVPAGRMQDKIGPRWVATIGGILVGLGMIVASTTQQPIVFMLGFGVLAGAGIGFAYASATPPAVKWFSAARTGLIAGIVVSGFGLASVYAAPLSNAMIKAIGVSQTMLILGGAFMVVVVGLAQLLKAPPKGYVPAGQPAPAAASTALKKADFTPGEMLRTPQFYMLWFMYACGAGAGLMVISKLKAIATIQTELVGIGFLLVAFLAIGNGAGRILAGVLSDRLGRTATMVVCFIVQAVTIFLLSLASPTSVLGTAGVMAVLSMVIGANYGANLSLFPSVTKDYYGLKNFGVNYGLVFTAWGLGGFMLAIVAGKFYDLYRTFDYAYYGACGLLVAAAVMTFFVKAPKAKAAAQAMPERTAA